jgi:hypothetical protein
MHNLLQQPVDSMCIYQVINFALTCKLSAAHHVCRDTVFIGVNIAAIFLLIFEKRSYLSVIQSERVTFRMA